MKETGIYCILNKINGKCYIGSTTHDFQKRWSVHKHQLNKNKHANLHLQSSWNKHGSENFEFSVLEIVEPKYCIEREQFYIDNIKPQFNILIQAGSPLGYRHSDASRKKRSVSLMGHILSKQTKDKISQKAKKRFAGNPKNHPMYGKIQSQEAKLKIRRIRLLQDMSTHIKSINQINKHTGLIIKSWSSIKSAANALNISAGNISSVCNNKLKSTGGFKWEFA